MSSQHNIDNEQTTSLTRRQLLKTTAAGTGAATVGVGADQMGIDLAQDAEAAAPLAAALLVTAAAGVVATQLNDGDVEQPEEIATAVQDNVHSDVSGIVGQRINDRKEIDNIWLNEPTDRNPLADSAWTSAEVEVTKTIVQGKDQTIQGVTTELFNQHLTRSYYNLIQKYNELWIGGTGGTGLAVPYTLSLKEQSGQFQQAGDMSEGSFTDVEPSAVPNSFSPVESTQVGSDPKTYALYKKEWQNPPTDPLSVPGLKEQLGGGQKIEIYAPVLRFSSVDTRVMVHPWSQYINLEHAGSATFSINNSSNFALNQGDTWAYGNPVMEVTHPNFDTLNAAPVKKWNSIFGRIDQTEVDLITGDNPQLLNYTSTLDQKLAEGVIDPVDILGPREALEKFDDSDSLARSAAELAFSGVGVPGQFGYKATVSHADLAADELEGSLFIRSKPGVDLSVNAGKTIPSTDYSLAYLNFKNRATGETERRVLGGDSPLEIVDVQNVDGTQNVTGKVEQPDSATGITIWPASDSDVPALLTDSSKTGTVEITAGSGTYTTPVSNVVENSGRYYVEQSTFSTTIDTSTIESIRLIPDVDYSSTVSRVEPGATVDGEKVERRVTGQKETYEALRKAFRDAQRGGDGGIFSGGLFGGGPNIPTLPGFGVVESIIIVLGGGMIASFASSIFN